MSPWYLSLTYLQEGREYLPKGEKEEWHPSGGHTCREELNGSQSIKEVHAILFSPSNGVLTGAVVENRQVIPLACTDVECLLYVGPTTLICPAETLASAR